jgi:16S rRNA (guanine527-N7)-methyltransferase
VNAVAKALARHCHELGIGFQDDWVGAIGTHLKLLEKWAPKINLSSVIESKQAVVRHVVDSLSLLQLTAVQEALGEAADVGSGAGFPGIPLAIALPHLSWLLIEPRGKRGAFLNQVIFESGIQNCRWFDGRVPDPALDGRFQLVVSRATFAPPELIQRIDSMVSDNGALVVMAAAPPQWDLPGHWQLEQVCEFVLEDAPRWIAALRKQARKEPPSDTP